ncbi:MAG: sulfite exporter TauE/SafE family protein, partial [Ignavibacteriaceae bacterium]|nr:sulfite exporter TauE/SafE family protein [Ignavibacteriaceae bacterium]
MQVFAGLIIGLFGSLHCIGMCGPIVAALGVRKNSHYYTSKLLYNLGRITTYALIGAVFGFFGAGLEVFGLQQAISVLTGLILLVTLFFDKIKKNFQIKSV